MIFVLASVRLCLFLLLLSALWWRRLRGLYKLPYERDWWWEKPVLALVGRALLSRALIQLSADEWGCTPSLIVFLPKVIQLYVCVSHSVLSLCDPMDYSLPGFSVHGILQARILKWVAISFSRGPSWPRDQTQVSCIAGRFFTIWATW